MKTSGCKTWTAVLVVGSATMLATACTQLHQVRSDDEAQDSVPVHTLNAQGYRTDDEIEDEFKKRRARLFSIYQQELKRNNELAGRIVFRITIQPSGIVSKVTVMSSTVGDEILENKIADDIQTMNFGSKEAPVTKILYPIGFFNS